MLSVNHHLANWATAIASVAIHRLVVLSVPASDRILRHTVVALALCVIWSAWKWPRAAKRTRQQLYAHLFATGCLLVAIGSATDLFQFQEENDPKPDWIVHLLLAYMAGGSLEALRQDRRDIEPAVFFVVIQGPRTQLVRFSRRHLVAYLASLSGCCVVLYALMTAADWVLQQLGGTPLEYIFPFFWKPGNIIQFNGGRGSAMMSVILGGPFADAAETIYYVFCRRFVPHLRGPLIDPTSPIPWGSTQLCLAAMPCVGFAAFERWEFLAPTTLAVSTMHLLLVALHWYMYKRVCDRPVGQHRLPLDSPLIEQA